MAVYSINRNGVEALSNLRAELYQAVNDIFEASERLKNNLNGLEDNLGIHYEHIMLENQKVILILKKDLDGEDGVGFFINNKLPKMISDMEMLIDAGLGDGEPPQKVLSLHR